MIYEIKLPDMPRIFWDITLEDSDLLKALRISVMCGEEGRCAN